MTIGCWICIGGVAAIIIGMVICGCCCRKRCDK